ncbi:MAG: hypothetical protein KAT58_07025, partial [candidate division Zixibacteria bacterium]|nr:hypothetical protein [candidate division Zixibacteria bacterium]
IDADLVEVTPISKAGILSSKKKEEPKLKVIYKYRDRSAEPKVEKIQEKPDSVVIIRGKNKETEAPAINKATSDEKKGP